VDEAYALVQGSADGAGSKDNFGHEALDTLMKCMEDMRESLVVILAGYTKEMDGLVAQNPGIKSRINHVITFEDYSGDELLQIAKLMLGSMQLMVTDAALRRLHRSCQIVAEAHDPQGGNGRFVRNQIDLARLKQAKRLCSLDRAHRTKEALMTLEEEDFEEFHIPDTGLFLTPRAGPAKPGPVLL